MYRELYPRKFSIPDLLKEFIKTDFKLRYKGSFLGFIWIIIKPLALYTILYIVWSSVFKTAENNRLFLFLGVIFNAYFNDGISLGLLALSNKAHIILKINFPREVVLISATLVALINFTINLGVVAVFAFFNPTDITKQGIVLFLCAIALLFFLILGCSYFLSILNIVFRDIRHIVELGLQVLFWITPILYNINQLPQNVQSFVQLNPLTPILAAIRTGLLNGHHITLHDWQSLLFVVPFIFILNIIGHFYFTSRVKKVAEFF